ncbi:glycosyltransferase family 4 protein [Desulforhopalus sp. IMCC35007]|uniref:glycosyltransferase family 4 protein n=1 Tax=Desulforhopalus sp. IMCC35007 TaxID=2569543 RepID=UPI0010AEAB7D|nr:glycosyltransferase family 4 protein [Desulforhopalus sp. IMCC35007]TKB07585.1 glycosyltransferase family 4 protein [Desulforhopalus sp. IMCC35007]
MKHKPTDTSMKIAYYMPFKTMGHPNPSGDLIIGSELYEHLNKNNSVELVSPLRARWIYFNPLRLLQLFFERQRIINRLKNSPPDLWFSYHSYYKAPDLLGPYCSNKLKRPYVIFQAIYSTKRRKNLWTLPGFLLNKATLEHATHIFTNKRVDHKNLLRLIPEEKLTYIAPGIRPGDFEFSAEKRKELRPQWAAKDEVLIITAAMMRPGVKTDGISKVIEACSSLQKKGHQLKLLIIGDGESRAGLTRQAKQLLPGRVHFLGKIPRKELYQYFSCADIFAFPGIQESLGMVYLEAQSCRLPAVAFEDWGGKEAIVHNQTGLLSPAGEPERFRDNIERLIVDSKLRHTLAGKAEQHIRANHNLKYNYNTLDKKLQELCDAAKN